jgi:hypothetical protein
LHGEEESWAARQPSLAIQCDAAARHDHVDMRVMGHGRAPGVEHGGDADVGAEMLGIGRDRQHGLGGGLEQQVIDDRLVVVGDIGDGPRQREDDVEVADRQQLRLTLGEPLLCRRALAFWAVPVAAAIVGDDRVRAVLAARDVAAERRGAAALDCAHHLHLVEADVPGRSEACTDRSPIELTGSVRARFGGNPHPAARSKIDWKVAAFEY